MGGQQVGVASDDLTNGTSVTATSRLRGIVLNESGHYNFCKLPKCLKCVLQCVQILRKEHNTNINQREIKLRPWVCTSGHSALQNFAIVNLLVQRDRKNLVTRILGVLE